MPIEAVSEPSEFGRLTSLLHQMVLSAHDAQGSELSRERVLSRLMMTSVAC